MKKKSYVFAGASSRALNMYAVQMSNHFSDCAELKGIYDINQGRAEVVSQKCGGIKVYDDFENMIKTEKPDCVIVTTVDAYHCKYIVKALELGCDVITEKPMTIDAKSCCEIMNAEKKYGKKVTVTFNYRYAPFMTKIKKIIKSGEIGDIYSVHFEWMLDRVMDFGAHGTSYFRRWNGHMEKSGGLLVHKSTHHFDLVNWWLDQQPEKVSAFGKLNKYGKNGAFRGERCCTCAHKSECEFYYELNESEIELYKNNEHLDGYHKDGCVYAEDIDIYDTMSVIVQYTGGAVMSYSLNATAAYEGWKISINGSKGRLEAFLPETGVQSLGNSNSIKIFDLSNMITEYKVSKANGGHGGGDVRLRDMLFHEGVPDPLGHSAGTLAGANSILVGIAANLSIKENRIVDIAELIGDASLLHR